MQDLQDRVLTLAQLAEELQQQLRQQEARLQAYERAAGDAVSEQHFTSAFENAAIGMAVLSLDSRRLRVNRAFCELFGYSKEELLAPGSPDRTHPDDYADDVVQRKRALAGEIDTYRREKRYLHKSGRLIWGDLTFSLVRDAAGQPLHFVSQLQDITQRKEAEQTLQQSEERFRSLTELSSDWFFEQDEHFRFVMVSGEVPNAPPGTAKKLIGKTPWELRHPDIDKQVWAEHRARLERHETFRDFEMPRRAADGQTFYVSISGVPVFDATGRFTGYRGIGRDTTAMRRIAEALRGSELRLREITDTVPALIAFVDKERRFRFHNQAYEEAFGITREQIEGKTMLEVMGEEFYERVRAQVDEVLLGYPVVYERTQITARGDHREYVVNYFPCYGDGEEEGEVIGFYSLGTDVTELKRIDRMKSEFVSTVSHELRTPLTSIRGSLGLISGGVAGQLPDAVKNLVGIAKNNCERLIRLINDILDIEKIESGKMRLELQPVELATLMAQAIAANEGYGLANKVRLALHCEDKDIQVNVEPDRLIQVVTNLLSNALKFSPPGDTVDVHVKRSGIGVRVEVRDHGPGIPEEFRGRIFQKFSQADSSDTRQKGGTGLGLNISRAIVERMGGNIGFETQLGEGTTFYFELPEWQAARQAGPQLAPLPRARILICEGDADVAKLISIMLDKAGFDSDMAHSDKQAWALLAAGQYDAVTLGLRLRGRLGSAFLNALRTDEKTRSLPVVVISALVGEGQLQLDQKPSAVTEWLSKPIDESRLVSTMQRAVSTLKGRKPRILHVEDDVDIQHIAAAIAADFASFEFAATLSQARARLQEKPFDLVLLDLSLGKESGWDLVEVIDALDPRPSLIVFSASEVLPGARNRPDAVLVKGTTSNADLLNTIQRVLKMPPTEPPEAAG
ncbi:PAS domain S-box protein [Polaromonas sp.]|uniref:PAS domain S-box protein n=1 Tax=Polaromonas sp. TaxID=1869339 RepID=UPI003266A7DE